MTTYESELKRIRKSCFSNDEQISAIIATKRFIDSNFQHNIDLEQLSRNQLLSKYHLLRLFKKYYGQTPRQHLIDKRIEQSKLCLANGLSVTETCFAVGFESLGSFSKLFKNKIGKSPSSYQKEQFSRSPLNSEC